MSHEGARLVVDDDLALAEMLGFVLRGEASSRRSAPTGRVRSACSVSTRPTSSCST